VRAQRPAAKIVYDLFHVVAKYSRQVINRVRVDEGNRIAALKISARKLKGYLPGILSHCG